MMFFEFTSWSWITVTVIFMIGGAGGFFIARQIKDKRTIALEQELKASREALSAYQADVSHHFLKTSLLFNRLTDNYREIYEHLATGAEKLCPQGNRTRDPQLPQQDIMSGTALTAAETNALQVESGQNDPASAPTTARPDALPEDAPGGESQQQAYRSDDAPSSDEPAVTVQAQAAEEEDEVFLGEESAPSIDIHQETNRSVH